MASDAKRVQAVFLMAAESPPDDRPALLERECGGDTALRQAVDSLLAAHDRPGSFLDHPLGHLDTRPAAAAPADLPAGTHVGPYKLQEKLGEGGMGAVWAAEQEHPVRRRVAVKLIKPGMDSAHVLRRFDAERQALALMDHPNIATMLDAGVEPTRGCPYFVMELVRGVPVTDYCDRLQLPVRERLGLFVAVCRAVQHAHQKGVVHRDLKPSNVLVGVPDGRPVPKVIDFGVAKALHHPLTDESLFTSAGTVVGSLQYMAPEQADLSPLDVDTRADVYGLGVLLYELLTGTTPLDPRRVRESAVHDTLRAIREEDPTRPSTRLSESADGLAALAARRKTDPARLTKEVSGDLDWIVMKCLDKDRTRRYETANALARDVERFLADEPVEARPPSVGYRVRKFVRRNRGGVVAAGLVLAALVLGVAGTTAGLVAAVAAADRAERRLAQLDKANDTLAGVFHDLDPAAAEREGRGLRVALAERLDRAAGELDGDAVGDPLTVARLQDTLGRSLRAMGYPARAAELHAKAAKTHEAVLGRDDRRTLGSLHALALAKYEAGLRTEAEPLLRDVSDRSTAALGADDPDTLAAMNSLAKAHLDGGRTEEAVRLFADVLDRKAATVGATDPTTLMAKGNLANAELTAGRPERTVELCNQALAGMNGVLADGHPDRLNAMNTLAVALERTDRRPEALPVYADIVRRAERRMGATAPLTLVYMNNRADALFRAGEGEEGVKLFERVLEVRREMLPARHPDLLVSLQNLAAAYHAVGRLKDALPLARHAAAAATATRHPQAKAYRASLCRILLALDEPVEAVPFLDEFVEAESERLGPKTANLANLLTKYGRALLQHRQFAAAEKLLRKGQDIRDGNPKAKDALPTFINRSLLGQSLLGQGNYEKAEKLLLSGYDGLKVRESTTPEASKYHLPDTADALIRLYVVWGKPTEVARWREERRKYPPEQLPQPRKADH